MKILQIIQKPELRGAEIFACQLSEELVKLGHTVDVVYLFENKGGELPFNLRFIPLGAIQKKRFFDFQAYKRLRDIIHNGGYDVVQANASDTLKYAAISKAIYRWKAPLIFRNASKMGDFMKSSLHRIVNRFFLRKCAYFISVSENCRQDLIHLYSPAAQCSCTISIGTYTFDSVPTVEHKTENQEPIFINVGSFVPEKNHKFLLEIFNAYFLKYRRGYLWLVGDGKLRKSLEELVITFGLEERVRFWGYRRDAISIVKASDVMVMPSHIEGLPGVILEALVCGVPVIASEVGGIPEIIHHNINGFCLKNFDTSSYVKHLDIMIEDEVLRKKITTAGKDLVHRKYLMPSIAVRFAQQYYALVQ